jgi:hypothetical protein
MPHGQPGWPFSSGSLPLVRNGKISRDYTERLIMGRKAEEWRLLKYRAALSNAGKLVDKTG